MQVFKIVCILIMFMFFLSIKYLVVMINQLVIMRIYQL